MITKKIPQQFTLINSNNTTTVIFIIKLKGSHDYFMTSYLCILRTTQRQPKLTLIKDPEMILYYCDSSY